jgi:hypothetical protein
MRAYRYPLELPLRYRSVGEKGWNEGTTANISRSGTLFRGEKMLAVDTEIEVGISLSASTASGAEIICRARVVRAECPTIDAPPLLAVAFSGYRFDVAHV